MSELYTSFQAAGSNEKVKALLEQHKGETIKHASCDHHSGCVDMYVVSVGQEGVALYEESSFIDDDDEDWDNPHQEANYFTDGNLYPWDVDFYISVKHGNEINTKPLRPLSSEELDVLLKVNNSIRVVEALD